LLNPQIKMLEIRNSKIFVEGRQTTDPTLIGLALLDLIEEKETIMQEVITGI
jgi:hypothetical protein